MIIVIVAIHTIALFLMDKSHFIPLHSALRLKKLFSVRKAIFQNFFLMLRFFLPPGQDITSLTYPDGFHQAQAVWLCETRLGLSAPSACCEKVFGSYRTVWRKSMFTIRSLLMPRTLSHFTCSFQREKRSLISIETSVSFIR